MNKSENRILGTGWEEQFLGGSPEAEDRLFAKVIKNVGNIQQCVSQRQQDEKRRAFHNKGHPLSIRFKVDSSIPQHLQTSHFQPGREFEGYARFSRSNSLRLVDKQVDQRGFAFRLLLDQDARQDFLFSNTPICFAPDPIVFLEAGWIFASTQRPLVPLKLLFKFGPVWTARILKRVLIDTPNPLTSFTSHSYWTRTPFRINDSAVKFTLKPNSPEIREAASSDPQILDEQLKQELEAGPLSFTLFAQHFVNENKTVLERADVEWLESDSPLVTIGELTLPQQQLGSEENQELLQRIESSEAFNPWVTEDILPLGAMNRSRREVYKLSAENRGGNPGKLCPFHHSSKN